MSVSPAVIVFGVQAVVKLGMAAGAAYEQHVRDREVSLPLLSRSELPELHAQQFFKQPEMRRWIGTGGPLEPHWDREIDQIGNKPGDQEAVEARWQLLLADAPRVLPQGVGAAGAMVVRQWDPSDPNRPPSPEVRIILALADVALDFAKASPSLLANGGTSEPLLKAIAAIATETRDVIPPLDDPDAWKGNEWLGANFGQSLLLIAFRVGLATLANRPDLAVEEKHVQRLITAAVAPLKKGFDNEATKAGATPASVLLALTRWERLRDQLLPDMIAAALQSVAADRNAFLGTLVKPPSDKRLALLVAGISNGVLDEVAKLDGDDLLQRQTWLNFFRASVAVIASRPELVVKGTNDKEQSEALRSLVKAIAGKLGESAQVGKVGRVVLLDIATAALDSVRTSLPMLLGPKGSWDEVAGKLAAALIDGVRPALVGDDPALLKRLASREQIATLVGIVLKEVATTPALLAGKHASSEAQAVLSAVAGAMAADGADLLHAEGWLGVATAAAKAAAVNPGKLFRLPPDGDSAIGARLIGIALTQASLSLKAAEENEMAPILVGPLLQDTIVALLELTARRRITPTQVDQLAKLLARLVDEARKDNGQILPAQLAAAVAVGSGALVDGSIKLKGDVPIDEIIKLVKSQIG